MKGKILVVEDDETYSKLLKFELERQEFQVISVSDGEAALASAQLEKPNVILLDVIISKSLGTQVLRTLKDDPQTSAIPVFIMSNYASRENEQKAMSLGAVEFIDKGMWKPSEIADRIVKHLSTTV
ncbi:response regulator [Candidatus Gottesmanbacteria bacterium]|nr:response regulator [Candidatus Gottesmanbacteria bacterium]